MRPIGSLFLAVPCFLTPTPPPRSRFRILQSPGACFHWAHFLTLLLILPFPPLFQLSSLPLSSPPFPPSPRPELLLARALRLSIAIFPSDLSFSSSSESLSAPPHPSPPDPSYKFIVIMIPRIHPPPSSSPLPCDTCSRCVKIGSRARHAGVRGARGAKRAARARYANYATHASCSSRARCPRCAKVATDPRNDRRAMRADAQGAERPEQTRNKRPADDRESHDQNTPAAPKATTTHPSGPGQVIAPHCISASFPAPAAINKHPIVEKGGQRNMPAYNTHNARGDPGRMRATDHTKILL